MLPPKIDSTLFDWLGWRSGSPVDFLVPCRSEALVGIRKQLQDHAVGWCRGENLQCRPKVGHKAVMFFKDGTQFWFHVTNEEFEAIFTGGSNDLQ
jgi:hypothetical protein